MDATVKRFTEDEICAIFDVPRDLIYDGDFVSVEKMENMRRAIWSEYYDAWLKTQPEFDYPQGGPEPQGLIQTKKLTGLGKRSRRA